MFGLLVMFGQLGDEPWYGNHASRMPGLATSPHHRPWTGRSLLSVPGPRAAPRHTRATLNVGDTPQRAGCGQDHTHGGGPPDARPLTARLPPPPMAGSGLAEG